VFSYAVYHNQAKTSIYCPVIVEKMGIFRFVLCTRPPEAFRLKAFRFGDRSEFLIIIIIGKLQCAHNIHVYGAWHGKPLTRPLSKN
jgi:hypothetical protein